MNKLNRGGRPEKEEKRTKEKRILFTDQEFETLNKIYLDSKIYHNLTEMMRDILLKNEYKIITTDQKLALETNLLIGSVKKIGNNFNQLLKHLNQKKLDNFSKDEKDIIIFNLQEIRKYYIKIENFLKNDS